MARVKNTSDQPLTMPVVGTVVRPGATVRVEKWDVVSKADTVRSWLRSNFLEVLDEADTQPQAGLTSLADEDALPITDYRLADLKAQAKDLGISVHHRWSDDRIQEEIDKKLAE